MNNQEILNTKKEILLYLSKRQVKDAIDLLMKLAVNLQNWKISEKLNELDTNYKFMLHYQFEGVDDPDQENVYFGFLRTLYELTDDVTEELLMTQSSGFFYEKKRLSLLKSEVSISDYQIQLKEISGSIALADLLEEGEQKVSRMRELSVKRERIANEMFMSVYLSSRTENKELQEYSDFLNSLEIKDREKCLLIAALTLSLFHRFDAKKVGLLMTFSINDNIRISQRAIVGLIIVLQMYDVRWDYYLECKQHLEALSENLYFKQSVLTIVKQLIRSRETEKISKKLTEEIIPEMMKFNSLAGKKLNMEDLMGETDFSDKNPEWKKELEESGLADKLQEYSSLQMEGADVFHSTFSSLKSFPFFTDISNWFLPFDASYSELQQLFSKADKESLLNAAIINSEHMCNSDKYSFCFSLLQLPESQREMMLNRFGAESAEMQQLQKEALALKANAGDEAISNQYIQDLYRFFKLYSNRGSFFDIFRLRINFYDKKSIAPLISETKDMKQIALYCFDKNFLTEALKIYELLAQKEEVGSDVWQKIGYCKQMLEDLPGALNAYLQADLIRPDNSWTIRRIAQLYRSQKDPQMALQYYLKLQMLTPDNIATELNIGHCYLDLNEYDKALNTYFKVELLDGADNPKAWRPIAWTAFLMKRFDVSQKYYEKILTNNPTEHDYLNAGHVELVLNNKKKALDFYMQAISKLDYNLNEFVSLFVSDKDMLVSQGIDEKFFSFLFDELKYKLG